MKVEQEDEEEENMENEYHRLRQELKKEICVYQVSKQQNEKRSGGLTLGDDNY